MQIPLLAFGHQSRVGKDTAAQAILRAVPGSHRVAFADALKALAAQMFGPLYGLRHAAYYETPEGAALRDVPLPGIGKSPVQLWIELGNNVRAIHEPYWIDQALRGTYLDPVSLIVITDLRFPNGFRAIKQRGGYCVRIRRPDAPPPKGSDNMLGDLTPWDAELLNDGTPEQLGERAVALARYIVRAATARPAGGAA